MKWTAYNMGNETDMAIGFGGGTFIIIFGIALFSLIIGIIYLKFNKE